MGEIADDHADMYYDWLDNGGDSVECDFCGKDDLHWVEIDDDVWRLYDCDDELHDCRSAKAGEDDFEDLGADDD